MKIDWEEEAFLEEIALDRCLGQTADWEARFQGDDRVQLERLLADPTFQARERRLRAWLDRSRASLALWKGVEDPAAQRVTLRVLQALRAETGQPLRTRELPAGWRGDWALVKTFWRARLADSVLLRIVAASLLVHLIAFPALAAYLIWTQPEAPRITFTFEPPVLEEEPEAEATEEIVPSAGDLWSELGLETDNTLAVARYTLSHPPALPAWAQRRDAVGLYWRARMARWDGGAAPWPKLRPELAGMWAVLALELALDQAVLAPSEPIRWSDWLAPVEVWLQSEASGDQARLALSALLRARAYGLAEFSEPMPARWAALGVGQPALAPGIRVGAPLDPAWLELFEAALKAPSDGWLQGVPGLAEWLQSL